MKQIILLVNFLLMFQSGFSQQHYYVNGLTGNDANSGTDLSAAWQTIQKACQSAAPNSTIHIQAGVYHENLLVTNSGNAGQPIVFLGDVGGVYIDGTGTSGDYLLRLKNANYLRFENMVFQNLTGNMKHGILVETTGSHTSTDLTFKKCKVRNIRWTALDGVNPANTDNAHGILVLGRNAGITNITFDGCEVANNVLGYSEALTLSGNISGFEIKNCLVHDNTNIGIIISGHRSISNTNDEARNGKISGNTCYNNVSNHATSGGIYVDGGNTVVIERNVSYNNGYGIEIGAEGSWLTYGVTVKNNVLYNNQGGGLVMGGYNADNTGEVRDCIVRNNSFFHNNTLNDGVGELHLTKASNCVIENNIFYTNDQQTLFSTEAIDPQTNNNLNHNCWYTPNQNPNAIMVRWRDVEYTTYNSYRVASAQDSNSEYHNPNFISALLTTPDFHLGLSSDCVNNGDAQTVVSSDEKDFDGNARIVNGIIDMGAFEAGAQLSAFKPKSLSYSLAPNPAGSIVKVQLEEYSEVAAITFFDSLGRKTLSTELTAQNSLIDISRLSNGIYMVSVTSGDKQQTSKLIIEK